MSSLVEFPLAGGGAVYVEVDAPPPDGPVVRGRRDSQEVVTRAERTFSDALDGLGPMLGGFIERVRAAAGPAEVEVEFAIKISADANVIVALDRRRGELPRHRSLGRGGGSGGDAVTRMTEAMEYDELLVRLTPDGAGYRVAARSAAGANATGAFELPFTPDALELLRLKLDPGNRRTRGRGARSEEIDDATRFGMSCSRRSSQMERFETSTGSRDAMPSPRGAACGSRCSSATRRVWARFRGSCCTNVPTFWPSRSGLPSSASSICRTPRRRFAWPPRSCVIGMISSPDDDEFQPLDTGAEKERVEGALRALIEANLVELVWLPHATLGALQRAIDHGGDFHVFHYIGHGEYDERSREGTLVLERENGRADLVTGERLGVPATGERFGWRFSTPARQPRRRPMIRSPEWPRAYCSSVSRQSWECSLRSPTRRRSGSRRSSTQRLPKVVRSIVP